MDSAETAEDSTGIGWASRGKPLKKPLSSSCSRVWRRIFWSNSSSSVGAGQVAVDQKVGNLEEAGVLGQLLDGVPAVTQDARIAVDVGDSGGGCCGVHEAGVKGDCARLLQQLGNVVAFVSFNNLDARELELASCMVQGCAVWSQSWSPLHEAPWASVESLIQHPVSRALSLFFQDSNTRAAFL